MRNAGMVSVIEVQGTARYEDVFGEQHIVEWCTGLSQSGVEIPCVPEREPMDSRTSHSVTTKR